MVEQEAGITRIIVDQETIDCLHKIVHYKGDDDGERMGITEGTPAEFHQFIKEVLFSEQKMLAIKMLNEYMLNVERLVAKLLLSPHNI